MLLNDFFKLYDLNEDICIENSFHFFSTEQCFDVLRVERKN